MARSRCFLAMLTIAIYADAMTVRIERTPGGPQIMVDGKLIPPRCFFGSRRGGYCMSRPEWTQTSFQFTPVAPVSKRGTLHFRFEKQPAEYWIKDVRVVDAADGTDVLAPGSFATEAAFERIWNTWPPGKQNTVGKVEVADGCVHVTMSAPPGGKWPDFHLHSDIHMSFAANHTYRCTFQIRSTRDCRVHPAVYRVEGGAWNHLGGPPGVFLEQVALARDASVRLISTSMPNCWTPPEQPIDWRSLDKVCQDIIDVHPKALLLPRVGGNAPGWWLERHPEARMVYEGDKPGRYATVSSRKYRADAAAHLEQLCRHLTEAFPDHFAAIHPCGQNTGEWFYEGSWGHPLSGYDPTTQKAWREWLALHGEPNAADTEVPSPEARHAAPNGLLRDPAKERQLILFNRFWQEEMADMVVELAAAARRGTGGSRLVVFFYGYLFEFGPLRNGAPLSGHYALAKALASPNIDVLCSPISYFDRQWKGTAPCMTTAESITANGKLWLNEDDTRTYLARTTRYGGVADLAQTKAVMLRNTAQAALRGFGTWWMDLPGLGWFTDKRIWDEHVRLQPVDEAMLRRNRPFTPEIAALVGEDSMIHLAGGSHVLGRPLIYESRAALGRCGAPYGQYLLRDAIAGRVPAKLQIYLAAWSLTPEQRQQLTANRRNGVTRVWCYAPGYLLPDRADVAAMVEVSGFRHRKVELDAPIATPTDEGRKLGLTQAWGPETRIAPLFSVVAEESDTVLATYQDDSPSVLVRRGHNRVDVFIGTPRLTSELVRVLARIAGAHLYTSVDAAVWAHDPFLSIHAMADGPLAIDTGGAVPVMDAFTNRPIGTGPKIELPIGAGETRVLRIQ